MRSFHVQKDFKSLLLADADLRHVLTPSEVEKAFDLDDQLRNVEAIFARVGTRSLVLITCGGAFDSSTGRYADNVVVIAEPRA